ncbi:MAG: hypothetical protein Q4D77_07810 [Peptostreptococcaceae bacterium]|nr:hypothetical protein [Peptostreptococcaceae bacterium]
MKRVLFVAVIFVAVVTGILYAGEPARPDMTTFGEQIYGIVEMKGDWKNMVGHVGSPSITYLNETNASILELGVFPFPKGSEDTSTAPVLPEEKKTSDNVIIPSDAQNKGSSDTASPSSEQDEKTNDPNKETKRSEGASSTPEKKEDRPMGFGMKTRGDVTEFVEGYLGTLGKSESLRTSKTEFLGYEANLVTSEYVNQFWNNERFLVHAWIFTTEDGRHHFIILESSEKNSKNEIEQIKNTLHF